MCQSALNNKHSSYALMQHEPHITYHLHFTPRNVV